MNLRDRLTMAADILREVAETAAGADRATLEAAAAELDAKAQTVELADGTPRPRAVDAGRHAGVVYH